MWQVSNLVRSPGDPRIIQSGPSSLGLPDRLGRALGWFSIGLGAMQMVSPRTITDWLGMTGREGLVCAFGAREIGAGVMTLSVDKSIGLWSRIAGDVLDLATLAGGLSERNPRRDNVRLALAAVLGITVLDFIAVQGVSARHSRTADPRLAHRYSDRSGFPKGIQAVRQRVAA